MQKKLPTGITRSIGYGNLTKFHPDCYKVARTIHAKVLEVRDEGEYYENYCLCRMQLREYHKYSSMNVVILRNNPYQMLAFSSTEERPFVFLNVPLLQAAFEALEYEVLSKEYLESDPTEQDIADLSAEELKDYRYWRPNRIGEIIFNQWD